MENILLYIVIGAIVLAIFSIYATSVYRYYKDEKEKEAKRCCQMKKYNK